MCMDLETNLEAPSSDPVVLSWEDVIVGSRLGSGSFASVYSVELVQEDLLRTVVDNDGTDTDSDDMTTATTCCLDESINGRDSHHQRRRLVVKCRKSSLPTDSKEAKTASRALHMEAFILKSLPRHPHIIRILGVSSSVLAETKPMNGFMILERVACTVEDILDHEMLIRNEELKSGEGFSLDCILRWRKNKVKSLQEEKSRVQRIVLGTASAMQFLHSHGILHRDLKPSNIGLGYDDKVRLLDFGTATICSENQKDRKFTKAVGTTRYMAPEVSMSDSYGFPADVHSFSIVVWEVLTLQKAFQGLANSKEEMRFLISRYKRRPPLPCVKSRALRRLLKSGWDANPERRPTFACIVKQLEMLQTSVSSSSSFCSHTKDVSN